MKDKNRGNSTNKREIFLQFTLHCGCTCLRLHVQRTSYGFSVEEEGQNNARLADGTSTLGIPSTVRFDHSILESEDQSSRVIIPIRE